MSVVEFKQDTPETSRISAAISFQNVLYATDFSPTSEAALPYATAICRRFGSTLHAAHIISDASLLLMTGGVDYVNVESLLEDSRSTAKEKLDRLLSRLCSVCGRKYVGHGQVWPNLKSIVAENAIDLIVVGTHGRTGLGKLLLGSVAEDILRHAPCPVLTVGPKVCGRLLLPEFAANGSELAPVELQLERILYATNFTPASLQAAPVAIGLAEELGARLTLMHVLESYASLGSRPGPIEDAVERLQALVKDAALVCAPETIVEFGSPWERIVKTAAERGTELLVLGASSHPRTTHVPWSNVHHAVAQATCPVLTVRGPSRSL